MEHTGHRALWGWGGGGEEEDRGRGLPPWAMPSPTGHQSPGEERVELVPEEKEKV